MGDYLDRFRLSNVDPDTEIIAWDYEKLKEEYSREMNAILIEWNEGDTPPEAGWYLGAVKMNEEDPDQVTTLMLWYNPSSIGKWYFGCGLGGIDGVDYNRSQAITGTWGKKYAVVQAWSAVPVYRLEI